MSEYGRKGRDHDLHAGRRRRRARPAAGGGMFEVPRIIPVAPMRIEMKFRHRNQKNGGGDFITEIALTKGDC
jgi:hypothetical protein